MALEFWISDVGFVQMGNKRSSPLGFSPTWESQISIKRRAHPPQLRPRPLLICNRARASRPIISRVELEPSFGSSCQVRADSIFGGRAQALQSSARLHPSVGELDQTLDGSSQKQQQLLASYVEKMLGKYPGNDVDCGPICL